MASEWLTYAAAGERLGLRPESIRQKAFRNHWPKRLGNDGFAQVKIDIAETLASAPPRRPRSGLVAAERLRLDRRNGDDEPQAAPDADHAHVMATLHARIVDLQAELMQLHVDRERERAELQADVADARQDRDRERSRADAERAHVQRLTDEIATLARALADAASGHQQGQGWRWPGWVDRLVHRSAMA